MQRVAVFLLVALAGCTAIAPPAPLPVAVGSPPGYPPRIGEISAVLKGKPVAWQTYDFSLGTRDASAQFVGSKAAPTFRMLGFPPGQPKAASNRLTMKGSGAAQAGALQDVLIEVIAGNNWDGLRLSSAGQAASLVLDKVVAKTGGYGHASGHFAAVLCRANGMPVQVDVRYCQDMTGKFETDFQYGMN